jgi:hypothetical protein
MAASAVLAVGVWYLSWQGYWAVAIMLVIAFELWGVRGASQRNMKSLLGRVPAILVGIGMALLIAVSVRIVGQIALAVLYGLWRWWWSGRTAEQQNSLANMLIVQVVMLQALFVMAAEWRGDAGVPEWFVLLLVWAGAYLSVFSMLTMRGERAAGLLAATWALIATEISWVLLRWLYVYTVTGGYILVPQPTLILGAVAYCFGSIYLSQRQGKLSRARLTEYLLIGLILIAIVITGTPWRGNI